MTLRHLAFGIGFIAAMSACGTNQMDYGSSDLSYIPWSTSTVRNSTIADARKEWLHVCLQGSVSAEDLERSKMWTRRAVLTWFRVAKTMDDKVTSNIRFTCATPDLTVRLRNGNGRSYASPSVFTVYMTRPYGTWTHELGHALAALGDTYSGSSAGACRSGQPQSLMCWGAYGPRSNPEQYSTLWPDDIAGLKYNYGKIMPSDAVAPDWANDIDLEAPLDLAEPWPGAVAEVVSYDASMMVEINKDLGPSKIDESIDTESVDL